MMVMYAGIRTLSGIILRHAEITKLEQIRTTVAAAPIPKALIALVLTAKVGQVPSTKRKTGFSFKIPFVSSLP